MKKVLSTLIILLIFVELLLKFGFGFGNPLLYTGDALLEYALQPTQSLRRLTKSIQTNSIGLRVDEVSSRPKVFKIGDSVINGGERLDNKDLSSSILQDSLNQIEADMQVVNVSCGSWGPENQLKFLKAHAELMDGPVLLYISSHDLHDTIGEFSPVGLSVDYPTKNPPLASYELLESFIIGKMIFPGDTLFIQEDGKGKDALQDFLAYLKSNKDGVHVFIHPTLREIEAGEYNQNGLRIIESLIAHQLSYTRNIELMSPDFYRDDIHLNEKGHEFLAGQAYQLLLSRGWID